MSHTYYFVSIENRQALPLGKAAYLDETGKPTNWEFTGFLDQETGRRICGPELFQAMTAFCSHNESRTMQVVPEETLLRLDANDDWEYFDTLRAIKGVLGPRDG